MKFKEAIGNNTKEKLSKWINDYIDGKPTKFVVLFGQSGNGKTFFIKLLAKEADMDLYIIDPESVTTVEDINNAIKGLNSAFEEKIILVDDFDYFTESFRKKLEEIPKIAKYPVVFTSSSWVFNKKFLEDGFVIKVDRFLKSELTNFLINNYNIDHDFAEKLADESKSIRSAILSLENKKVNTLTRSLQTRAKTLQDIKQRRLQDNINMTNIKWLFRSIRGYSSSALSVMLAFAEYDYKVTTRFQEIDPFLVNNMQAPIEKVELRQVFDNHNNKKVVKKKVIKIEKPKVKEIVKESKKEKKFATIDDFLG